MSFLFLVHLKSNLFKYFGKWRPVIEQRYLEIKAIMKVLSFLWIHTLILQTDRFDLSAVISFDFKDLLTSYTLR